MTRAFWLFNSWNKDKGYVNSYAYEKSRSEYSKLRTEINLANNPFKGKKHTEEWKEEQSKRSKARWEDPEYRKKQLTNNSFTHLGKEHYKKLSKLLKGKNTWTKGTYYWNNGEICIRSAECPGEGWVRGRLFYKNKPINI